MVTLFHIFLLFTFTLCVYLIRYFVIKKTSIPSEYPPSPPALPIIGHMHLLTFVLHKSFQDLASRYGPFLLIRVGATRSYLVSDGKTAKEVFKTHDIKFSARPDFGYGDYQIYKDTLFSTLDYTKYWTNLKKILMMELLSPQQINRFSEVRKEEMMNLLEILAMHSERGEPCDLTIQLMAMTNNLVSRLTMSKRCSATDSGTNEIREISKGITLLSGKLSLGEVFGPLKRFDIFGAGKNVKALLLRYDKLMDDIITEHDQKVRPGGKRERRDMMDILLQIADEGNAEVNLTRHGIKAFFLDLFLGGTDTTSVALQWAMAELLNHPKALKKLQEEIDKVVGQTRLIEDSDIPNLPHLQAVVKEAPRLHPSLPLVFRKCREDCKINSYNIRKNSRFVVNLFAINRDPNVWEDAPEFKPERFMASSMENHSIHHDSEEGTKVQNFNYVPFGGGRRGCPGAGLAAAVLHRTLGTMIQCFDWKIKGADKVDMEEGAGFSAAMVHPLVCYPIMRVNPLKIA